ncbi:MAG: hypothetical protein V1744_02005 [Candidatus Altiarchaeota archaeon]
MDELYTDGKLRESIAKKSRQKVASFSTDSAVGRMLRLYHSRAV